MAKYLVGEVDDHEAIEARGALKQGAPTIVFE